jgi:hypothetical protein
MKIKAKTNGDVIDVTEATAKELIEAGIYDAVDESPTAVAPLGTESVPVRTKKAK